jgi:tetratricopeptide (TPR) repeat protein
VKRKPDITAVKLNDQAMLLVSFIENPDSARKAIQLLDSATKIDSSYFLAYYNKLMFFSQLNLNDEGLRTLNKLIVLRPYAHDLYMMCGLWYERIGHSDSSQSYFEKSLSICNTVLDSMSIKNKDYFMLVGNKAINLTMLGDSLTANGLLKNLYDSLPEDSKFGNVEKDYIYSLIGKSKSEILKTFSLLVLGMGTNL